MAHMLVNSAHEGVEMYQKGRVQSIFADSSRPISMASTIDTEFEEDASDFDDYQGRRSEESFGNTTVSTYEELRTPASNDFRGFNFGLPPSYEKTEPSKAIQGPTGPHLFRYSQQSTPEEELFLEWSPVESPRRAGPAFEPAPSTGTPLETWSVHQVCGWMRKAGFDEAVVKKFKVNDISGQFLQHLHFGDLKELGILSFGQRHMLWDAIRNLRGGLDMLETPLEECFPPSPPLESGSRRPSSENECSSPAEASRVPPRRARRALRPEDDIISPAESASIVAIEQLLPEPHTCPKGESCAKWRKWKRKMDKIAKEFPLEMEQIEEGNAAPSELTLRPTSEAVPSVVASSDLLGQSRRPALRLDPDNLRGVQNRDPQEHVRQFLNFQHMATSTSPPESSTPQYEMFPPMSPPATQAPLVNLNRLPKLQIPAEARSQTTQDPDRTAIQQYQTPVTAIQGEAETIYRFASPASDMDVPVTTISTGPIERDTSNSVPPDMRYGHQSISRAQSRGRYRPQPFQLFDRSQSTAPIERSTSTSQRRPIATNFAMAPLAPLQEKPQLSSSQEHEEKTPTGPGVSYAGWMKKRKTKMLHHQWNDGHFRLKGTQLAMHRDEKTLEALDSVDVDEYSVACSTMASNKVNAAFKALKLSSNKKKSSENEVPTYEFQLVPAAEKRGFIQAATGRSHHFAVTSREDRIGWMRELMLAKAMKQKRDDGCEVNVNGHAIA